MKNWNTITELLRDYQVLVKMTHALFGIYVWELLTSMDFEWDFIRGRKKFRWPFTFYVVNRYSLLLFLSLQLVLFNHSVQRPFACQAIYTLSYLFGQTALLTASINLAIRTIVIWSNIFVTAGLTLTILGNAVVLVMEVYYSRASFVYGVGCTPSNPDETASWLRAAFLYAMILDFVVLALSFYKLTLGASPKLPSAHESDVKSCIPQSRLIQVMFKHGMIYYLTAFLTDLLSIIFLSLRLNVAMNNIALSPTQVISTIAACRAVRALANFGHNNAHNPTSVVGSGKSRSTNISKTSTSGMGTEDSEGSFALVEARTFAFEPGNLKQTSHQVETVTRRDTRSGV